MGQSRVQYSEASFGLYHVLQVLHVTRQSLLPAAMFLGCFFFVMHKLLAV